MLADTKRKSRVTKHDSADPWSDVDIEVEEVNVRTLSRKQLRNEIVALLEKHPGLDAFEMAGDLRVPTLEVMAAVDELVERAHVRRSGSVESEPDMAAASVEAFAEVWDNEHDAVYDNWRERYGVSEG